MSNSPYFKVILNDPEWDVRAFAKRLSRMIQLYVAPEKPKEVFIKYQSESGAELAKNALLKEDKVVSIEPMDNWPFAKPTSKSGQTTRSRTTMPGDRFTENSDPAEHYLPLSCKNCLKTAAEFVCSVCSAWYCSESCQLKDWAMGHRLQCMPKLVRGFSVVNSALSNLAEQQDSHIELISNETKNSRGAKHNLVPKQLNDPKNVVENGQQVLEKSVDEQQEEQRAQPIVTETETEKEEEQRVCTTLASLPKRATDAKRTLIYGPFPAVGSKVTISFVTENNLYIHEVDKSKGPQDPYRSYTKRAMNHAREVDQTVQIPPAEGDIVFALYEEIYYRAVIRQLDGDSVTVFFPDYGNSDCVPWKFLKEIKDENIKYANCITHAASICSFGPFSPAQQAFLTNLIEADVFEVTRVEDVANSSVKAVELRHVHKQYLLDAKLRAVSSSKQAKSTKATKLVVPDPATYEPVRANEFKDPIFTTKKVKREVLIVDGTNFASHNLLSAMHSAKKIAYGMVLDECSKYGTMDNNQYIMEDANQACLVLYEGIWTRAFLLDDNRHYLMDMGLLCVLDKSTQIRRFPPALSRTMYCSEYLVDNPDELLKVLKDNGNVAERLIGKTLQTQIYHDPSDDNAHMIIESIVTN